METVLVVDDNADTCDLMVRLLRRAGFRASYVTGGGGALAHLRDEPADVLILDLMMPGLDGAEVLRRLRGQAKYDRMVVVAFSAIDDPDYIRRVLSDGADAFWVKGKLDHNDVPRQLAELIARRTHPRPANERIDSSAVHHHS